MDTDREQCNDIAEQYPEVVEKLRAEYEIWWEIVSQQFGEEIPFVIDAGQEHLLTCHDWRNDDCNCPYNQGQIREGMEANGYWEIEVERDGKYLVELRRWPREADRALADGIDGDDVEWRMDAISKEVHFFYTGGRTLPIKLVKLRIGEHEFTQSVSPNDKCASFLVDLKQGPTHLQTWLTDGNALNIGAYYVGIKMIKA